MGSERRYPLAGLACGILLGVAVGHAAPVVRVGEREIKSSTAAQVPVTFQSDVAAAAYQMDMTYDGNSYLVGSATKGVGDELVDVNSNVIDTAGVARVVVSSYMNGALPEGVAFNVPLTVRRGQRGSFPVALTNFRVVDGTGALLSGSVGLSIKIAHLTNDAKIQGTDGVMFEVEFPDAPGGVTRVEYYVNGVKIGQATTGPFTVPWQPGGLGAFTIRVVAFNASGTQLVERNYDVVVTNPIASAYRGLITANPKTHATSGIISITTAVNNALTAKVTLGGQDFSGIGKFGANSEATISLTRKGKTPLALFLRKSATGINDTVTGLITDGTISNGQAVGAGFVSQLRADRLVWDGKLRKAPSAGVFTFALAPDADAATQLAPLGTGYGTGKVGANGKVTLTGVAADGSKWTTSTSLSKESDAPVYLALNAKKGAITGLLTFREIIDTSDFDGPLDWFHPALPSGAVTAAFHSELGTAGARYTKPAANRHMIPLANVAGNAEFIAEEGGLAQAVDLPVTINSKNVALVPIAAPENLKLTLVPGTGLFSGSFKDTASGQQLAFNGAVIQKQDLGSGFFLTNTAGGSITLQPNPLFPPAAGHDGVLGSTPLPVIAIQSPAASARIASPADVTIKGTAKDKQGIAEVRYQIVHGRSVSDIAAATGTTTWTIPLDLDPDDGGLYTVHVKAIDQGGNESPLLSRAFVYVVQKTLAVTVVGKGKVTAGFAGTTQREIGKSYSVTATPTNGAKFTGWTGSVVSVSPTITFTMAAGFTLQATFK